MALAPVHKRLQRKADIARAWLKPSPARRQSDSFQSMQNSPFMTRFNRWVAALLLVTFTSASLAQEATIRVTRKATDQYAVSKSEVVITTKYCHEYSRDDEFRPLRAADQPRRRCARACRSARGRR